MEWYQKTAESIIVELRTDPQNGLSEAEAEKRLAKYGHNALAAEKKEHPFLKFLKQFTEFIIVILMGAAVIAGVLGEWVDSLAIMAIVIMNGVIGFLQEAKAEKVMEALKKLSAPSAKVIRGGQLDTIPASTIVPGDIIAFESGDHVPADCRVIESNFLKIAEAALTGESHAIEKETEALENSLPLADRINMAFMGTNVVYGRGKAVAVSTGMSTEMGKIAKMLQQVKPEPTPLQRRLAEFGRLLVYAAGVIVVIIFLLGIMRGEPVLDMFLVAVSLAVAAIPEGLPAVVTIVLALGVQRMVKRHALVRKLPSVETLGAATLIASDKTGTLTQNQMTVKRVFLDPGEYIDVTGTGYAPAGVFLHGQSQLDPSKHAALRETVRISLLCNSAELKEENGAWKVIGDPTEGALLTLGMKAGVTKDSLLQGLAFVGEAPFDSERKMMTTVFREDEKIWYAFIKGAAEKVLPLCSKILGKDGPRPMTEEDREAILRADNEFSNGALRVLALAYRESTERLDLHSLHLLEKELVFTGLVGMIDPPRQEVFEAVKKARSAGITPLMITGDHKATAIAIGTELGIYRDGDIAITGEELDRLSDKEFIKELPRIKIYARVNPEHKLRVVKAWKGRGETIAMTGDGVNDAPALREADIGIAMGITGTDVTKEASDMVLTDDNFASIVAAVEEGRGIFNNIRRVVHFLLSCNIGEILVLLVASLAGMPLPLLPIQILWTNLVTDGLPALGLAMEQVEPDVMKRPPRKKSEGIVTKNLMWVMLIQGVFIGLCTLAPFILEVYWFEADLVKAQTMAFTVLVFCQKFHVFNCRSAWKSVFKIGVFSNRTLNWAVLIILSSQLLLVYVPALQGVFGVVPLSLLDWAIVVFFSIQPLLLMELVKWVYPEERWLRRARAAR
jgi:Ca2+-transporting ATPase